jgi:hypothetical protein
MGYLKKGPGGNQGRKPKPTAMRKTHYVLFTMRSFQFKISSRGLATADSIGQRANTIVGWGAFICPPWQPGNDRRTQKNRLKERLRQPV